MHTSDPQNGEKCFAFLTGNDNRLLPQQEEEKITPRPVTTQPIGDCHNSASEKSLYFELSVSSNGLFIYNSSSQVVKRAFSPLFLWTSYDSPLDRMS